MADKIPAAYTIVGNKIIINPTSNLDYNKEYKIVVSTGVKDVYEDELDALDDSNTFTTVSALAITSSFPVKDTDTHDIEDDITVTFNNNIKSSTATIENIWLWEVGMDKVSATYTINNNVVTINPTDPLIAGANYKIVVSTGVEDEYDDTLDALEEISFRCDIEKLVELSKVGQVGFGVGVLSEVYYYNGVWTSPIVGYSASAPRMKTVKTDINNNVFYLVQYGGANVQLALVKVMTDGTVSTDEIAIPDTSTTNISMDFNADFTKLYVYINTVFGGSYILLEYNTSDLSNSEIFNETGIAYSWENIKLSNDSNYIWAVGFMNKIHRVKISDLTSVSITASLNISKITISGDVVWGATSYTDGKISKFIESGGGIIETSYSNSDMVDIESITVDKNGDIICLQRSSSGVSKLFKVNTTDGQTLHSYYFDTNTHIYNISTNANGDYYVDRFVGNFDAPDPTRSVFKFEANNGGFNTPVNIGEISLPLDDCNYTGYYP